MIELGNVKTTALPDQAIVGLGDKNYIFVKSENDRPSNPSKKKSNGEYAFDSIEIQKGVSPNGYTEIFLPDGFDTGHAEIVVKGAYDLLSKLNNSEEE